MHFLLTSWHKSLFFFHTHNQRDTFLTKIFALDKNSINKSNICLLATARTLLIFVGNQIPKLSSAPRHPSDIFIRIQKYMILIHDKLSLMNRISVICRALFWWMVEGNIDLWNSRLFLTKKISI